MKRVSVIIPTYNYGKYIERSIRSVLNQRYDCLECIVIDDGSTDNTYDIIENIPDRSIKYAHQSNRGAGAARNLGIEMSRGEYLIFLDADDALGANQVTSFIDCSNTFTHDIIYGPWKQHIEQDGSYQQIFARERFPGTDLLEGWLSGWYVSSCSIFWPRKIVNHLEGWDETLTANQDGDIAMRALIEGFRFRYCDCAPAFVAKHSSERASLSDNRSIKALQSRLSVLLKVENLLKERGQFQRYRRALSESYYSLALHNVFNSPDFSNVCYQHFRRLRGYAKPPGSIFNWLFVTILGLVNKERLSHWAHSIIETRIRI